MSLPFVSVLITAYNYGRFIEEAIDSVLSQDFPSDQMEIVVADDGSTDDTAERVRKYGSKVRYFHRPNGGQAAALNLGFAKARGEIITLLDGDDFFFPGKLTRVAEAFKKDPALGMVYHPMEEWNAQTSARRMSRFPLISGSPFEDPDKFLGYLGQGTNASFRRKFLQRVLPIPEQIRMLADCYPCTLIVFVAPILAIPECLSAYRVHGSNSYQIDEGQIARETQKKRALLWRIVIDAMCKWVFANGYTMSQIPVRYLVDSWRLYAEYEAFRAEPPSRVGFFRHVLLENHLSTPMQNWRLTTFNYLTAFSALFFGYQNARRMYDWRGRTLKATERVWRTFFSTAQRSNGR